MHGVAGHLVYINLVVHLANNQLIVTTYCGGCTLFSVQGSSSTYIRHIVVNLVYNMKIGSTGYVLIAVKELFFHY